MNFSKLIKRMVKEAYFQAKLILAITIDKNLDKLCCEAIPKLNNSRRSMNSFFSSSTVIRVLFCLLLFSRTSAVYAQNRAKLTVNFDFDSYSLDQNNKQKIDKYIKNKTITKIQLRGYCDSVGSFEYNEALSMKRVMEVKKYLLSLKMNKEIIIIAAQGEKVLLNKSQKESERALNRRVEIELNYSILNPSKSPITKADEIKEVVIKGMVFNEEYKPLVAEISLNNKDGLELQKIMSGSDGSYSLKTKLSIKEDYYLNYYNDSSFIGSQVINLSHGKQNLSNITTILPVLRGGKKYVMQNFNFEGDTSQLMPGSVPSLHALYKLMKKNNALVIQIEGHVNYPSSYGNLYSIRKEGSRYSPRGLTEKEFCQWLSDERAKMVFDYLVEKGIETSRLSKKGLGSSQMLYPDAYTEDQMMQNRRVEIKIVSFDKK